MATLKIPKYLLVLLKEHPKWPWDSIEPKGEPLGTHVFQKKSKNTQDLETTTRRLKSDLAKFIE